MESVATAVNREPWNKGKIVGQKAPFKLKDIWALRVRLQMENRVRELALFNLGIDSKLRGCDLVGLKAFDEAGIELGVVAEVWSTGPVPNLVIRGPAVGELMVPFVDEFVPKVELEAGRVTIRKPEYVE